MEDIELIDRFKLGEINPKTFTHQDHIRVAFGLLTSMPFLEACIAMRDGLRKLAIQAGKPDLYHETITVAFMAIVLERLHLNADSDIERFLIDNPDLSDRALLNRYYPSSTLQSPLARMQFVLNERPHSEILTRGI